MEWIEHDGNDMPVPANTIVDLKWGNGVVSRKNTAGHFEWDIPTDPTHEDFGSGMGVIVAYRIVKEGTKP